MEVVYKKYREKFKLYSRILNSKLEVMESNPTFKKEYAYFFFKK